MFRKSSDPYEEILNQMLRRTMRGEVIPFDEFLDNLEDLEEEPEETPTPEEGQQAAQARERFQGELRLWGLPPEQRFELCVRLWEKAKEDPSLALLRLQSYLICDTGLLLDPDTEERDWERDALCWKTIQKEAEELYVYLVDRRQKAWRFSQVLEEIGRVKQTPPPGETAERLEQVVDAFLKNLPLRGQGDRGILSDNVDALLHLADSSQALHALKPLFLYRVLTRHGKRLQTVRDLRIDLRALWNPVEYRIDRDNGKNVQSYQHQLALFEALYGMFASDAQVDAPLNLYGFSRLSNLGEFYLMQCPEKKQVLPFDPSVELIFVESLCQYSCFPRGAEDNVLQREGGISQRKLQQFERNLDVRVGAVKLKGKRLRRKAALKGIAAEMDRDAEQLVEQFRVAAPEQVEGLCREILERSALPEQQMPQSPEERSIFLAWINQKLMEAVDELAWQYLARACQTLLGEGSGSVPALEVGYFSQNASFFWEEGEI